MKLIDKSALVTKIERMIKVLQNNPYENHKTICHLDSLKQSLDTFEVKEVDLELIIGWFDHIAQIADDRMTLTNQRMTDAHALDEIKCLAKNSSEFIAQHYKAQKGE